MCFNGLLSADYQVLDSGRLKEYDEPYVLLQNKESLFYKMVQQLGKGEAAALTETAKQVSVRQGAVIKVCLTTSFLTIWHHGSGNKHCVPPFNYKPPDTKLEYVLVEVRSGRLDRSIGDHGGIHTCASRCA